MPDALLKKFLSDGARSLTFETNALCFHLLLRKPSRKITTKRKQTIHPMNFSDGIRKTRRDNSFFGLFSLFREQTFVKGKKMTRTRNNQSEQSTRRLLWIERKSLHSFSFSLRTMASRRFYRPTRSERWETSRKSHTIKCLIRGKFRSWWRLHFFHSRALTYAQIKRWVMLSRQNYRSARKYWS